jgi:hypothetical protein
MTGKKSSDEREEEEKCKGRRLWIVYELEGS